MKISCPACQSKYTIADEKVQGRAVKVRCRKCGEMIHVGGSSAAAPGVVASAAAFSVLVAEGDQRDMSLQEIIDAYNNGVITADTYVWGEGQADWAPLEQVSAIVDAINQASASPEAPREVAAQQLQSDPPPVVAAAPATATPAPVPVASAKQSPLFGQAAPAAAPVAQDHVAIQNPKRRDVDLFGGRSKQEEDVATSAPAFPVAAQAKPTGTREESSMLFSLTALTSATPAQVSGPSALSEDSGLIDLKELAAKADAPKPQSAVPFLDAAPLLGSPLIDVPPTQEPEPEIRKSKSSMLIGVGISIAGVAIAAAIFFATRKPPPLPVPAAAPVDTPTTTEPAAAATPSDTSGAAPPSTGAPSATAKTAAGAKGGRPAGGTTAKGTNAGKPPSGGGEQPAATPGKPKSPCGCAPNDLMCNMNCAVGKK